MIVTALVTRCMFHTPCQESMVSASAAEAQDCCGRREQRPTDGVRTPETADSCGDAGSGPGSRPCSRGRSTAARPGRHALMWAPVSWDLEAGRRAGRCHADGLPVTGARFPRDPREQKIVLIVFPFDLHRGHRTVLTSKSSNASRRDEGMVREIVQPQRVPRYRSRELCGRLHARLAPTGPPRGLWQTTWLEDREGLHLR